MIIAIVVWACLMLLQQPADAVITYETYHLHDEASEIDANAGKLLIAGPDTAAVEVQSTQELDAVGEVALRSFETQSGDPGWANVIPAGSIWTFDLWLKQSSDVPLSYPKVKLYIDDGLGTPFLTVTGATPLTSIMTKFNLTAANADDVVLTATDRIFAAVSLEVAEIGGSLDYGYLGLEGITGGANDSSMSFPIDRGLPVTTLSVDPIMPNGINGWYKTAPTVTLTRDEPGVTLYSWDSSSGPWTTYFEPFSAIIGSHTLYYYSIDNSSNTEAVQSQAFNVDTAVPSSSITAPVTAERIRGASYTITGTANDSGASGLSRVEVSINASAWQTATGTASWSYTWTLGADGDYNVRSRAVDTAGNIETAGAGIDVSIDNTPPVVSSTDPVDGATEIVVETTVKAVFSEDMDPATINTTMLTLKDSLDVPVTGVVSYDAPSRTAMFTPSANLASKTYYTATVSTGVKDVTGNAMAADKAWTFQTKDVITPVTTMTINPSSPDGDNGWYKSVPSITLSSSEPGYTNYSWIADAEPWTTYTVPFDVPLGVNTFYYYSVDSTGNEEAPHLSQAFNVDTAVPSSSIVTPSDGASLRGAGYIITGTATDSGASGVSRVEISIDQGLWTAAAGTTNWTYSWTFPGEGQHNIRARAVDNAGNTETAGSGIDITVDNTPPKVTSTSPADGQTNVAVDSSVSVTFSEDIDPATLNTTTFYIRDELGNPVPGLVSYDSPGKTATFNPDGNLASKTVFTVTVTTLTQDLAGNPLAADYHFSFTSRDVIAPTTTISTDPIYPDGTNDWFKTVPSITLTSSEPGSTYYSWSYETGPWTAYSAPFMAELGIKTLYYYSEDVSGNTEPVKNSQIKTDSEMPSSNITDPAPDSRLKGQTYTITGTAQDTGASGLARVEISINSGPWQIAVGTESWTYVWTLGADGAYEFKVRAADNAGNMETANTGISVTVDNSGPSVISYKPSGSRYYAALVRVKDQDGANHYEGNEVCGVCHGSNQYGTGRILGGDHITDFTGLAAHDTKVIEPGSGTKIKCSNCHEPHGSKNYRLTYSNEEQLCYRCHNSDNLPNSLHGEDIQADFARSSHHALEDDGGSTKIECSSCHNPHVVRDQDGMMLSNPDNTKMIHSGNTTSFCLKCHDGDPPNEAANEMAIVPYTIGFPAIRGSFFPGWDKLGFLLNPASMSTIAECSTCHNAHGSDNQKLLSFAGDNSTAYAEEKLCLACHSSGNQYGAKDISALLQKSFKHPVDTVADVHSDEETGQGLAFSESGSKRHAECVDCHDPHEAMNNQVISPSVKGPNNGASGVNENGQPLLAVAYEYEICYKCHSSFTIRPPDTPDVSWQFSSSNESYHPVTSIGKNQGIDGAAFVQPWNSNQQIYCSDCHGNEDPTGAKCLTGSANEHILKDAYGDGQTRLCFRCHNAEAYITPGTPGSRWTGHNANVGHSDCSICHETHGSKQSHLINRGYLHYENGGIIQTDISCSGSGCHTVGQWLPYYNAY